MHGCISVGEAMGGESRPLICTKCCSEMVVLAIITNPEEVQKILFYFLVNMRNNMRFLLISTCFLMRMIYIRAVLFNKNLPLPVCTGKGIS